MRCTDYGRVNVRIRKNQRGMILLEYEPWGNDDSTVWYCVLNARNGYKMQCAPMADYITHMVLKNPERLPLSEAQEWLRKYCAYHRMNPEDFMIVQRFATRQSL